MENRRVIITVLGARSGTSALAGTLGLIGCTLPKNLLPANWSNPKGHFEPQDIATLHEEILKSVGSVWSDWREFPVSWFESTAATEYRQKLAEAFEDNYGKSGLAVLKEPRMCRMLPLWDGVYEDLASHPVFCFIDRDPLEVAASLQARDGSSMTQGLSYYIRNHLDAERATRKRVRAFISYNDLLADWEGTITSVGVKLGISFPEARRNNPELSVFIQRELRHQNGSAIDYQSDSLHAVANAVHAAFMQLSVNGEQPDIHSQLDELRAAFNLRQ